MAAQAAFEAGSCRAGDTLAMWCASSQDVCCALCPNSPVTGPATVTIWCLSTLFNLGLMLWWTGESAYNIYMQILGTDGFLIALVVRSYHTGGGISEFHASFAPWVIMSCIPVVVAGSLASTRSLHSQNVGSKNAVHRIRTAPVQLRRKRVVRKPQIVLHEGRELPFNVATADRKWLPFLVQGLFFLHLLLWSALFPVTFGRTILFTQPTCGAKFDFSFYRTFFAVACVTFIFVAFLAWVLMGLGLRTRLILVRPDPNDPDSEPYYTREDALTYFTKAMTMNPAAVQQPRHKRKIRALVGLILYVVWVSIFVGIYVDSLNKFLMLGDDAFDFGQINGIFGGVLLPFITVCRAFGEGQAASSSASASKKVAGQADPEDHAVAHTTFGTPGDADAESDVNHTRTPSSSPFTSTSRYERRRRRAPETDDAGSGRRTPPEAAGSGSVRSRAQTEPRRGRRTRSEEREERENAARVAQMLEGATEQEARFASGTGTPTALLSDEREHHLPPPMPLAATEEDRIGHPVLPQLRGCSGHSLPAIHENEEEAPTRAVRRTATSSSVHSHRSHRTSLSSGASGSFVTAPGSPMEGEAEMHRSVSQASRASPPARFEARRRASN